MTEPANQSVLRVFVITQDDPRYVAAFFDEFLNRLTRDQCAPIALVGAMIQKPLGNKTSRGLFKRVYGLYGFWGTFRMVFRIAWARLTDQTVAGHFQRHHVPVYPGANANSAAFRQWVQENRIDLIVSVAAAQIFKEPILDAPPMGCINLHNAPLPDYRGMLPNFWQMYHGESESVLTIHKMVPELDKGDILLQHRTTIDPGETLDSLMLKTKRRSAGALCELLAQLARGPVEAQPLPDRPGSYFTFPTKEDAAEFRRRGYRVI